jgi:hypothetical protein
LFSLKEKTKYLEDKGLRGLPSEVGVGAAEVTVSGGLLEHRSAQVKVADDSSGAEVEVVLDDLSDLSVGLLGAGHAGAVGVHEHGQGVGHTDGVGQLHKHSVGEAGGNQGLGDPAGSVGGGAIHLGGVLAGEGSTTVGSPTAIGINDDLSAGQTSITVRTTNDEAARGVQVVDGLLVEVLGRDDGLDHVLHELGLDLLLGDVLAVLGGDHDGVDADGDGAAVVHSVLAGHLGLAVGSHPRAGAVLADLGQAGTQGGGQLVGQGHEGLGLIGGIAEHDTLVTGTNVLDLGGIDGLGDIGGLLLDGNNDVAGSVVKTLVHVIVTDVLEGLADHLLVVDGGGGGDLTEDHNHAGLGAGLCNQHHQET